MSIRGFSGLNLGSPMSGAMSGAVSDSGQRDTGRRRLASGYTSAHSVGHSPQLAARSRKSRRRGSRQQPKAENPEESKKDRPEAEANACKHLPAGFRALTNPHGFNVDDGGALYGFTTRWPFVKHEPAKEKSDAAATKQAPTRWMPTTGGDCISAESLRWGHMGTFRAGLAPDAKNLSQASEPQRARSTCNLRHTSMSFLGSSTGSMHASIEDTSLQIYISPHIGAAGMTVTHLFLSGQCLGDVQLFVPDAQVPPRPSSTPPLSPNARDREASQSQLFVEPEFLEPLTKAGLTRLAEGRGVADLVGRRYKQMQLLRQASADGVHEYHVIDPVFSTSALLVVLHEGDLTEAHRAKVYTEMRRSSGKRGSGEVVDFYQPSERMGLLSPAATTPFVLGEKQYATLQECLNAQRGGSGADIQLPALHNAVKAKFEQHPAARAMLISSMAGLVYNHPTDAVLGMGRNGHGANLLGKAMEKVRGELLAAGTLEDGSPKGLLAGATPLRDAANANVENILKRWGGLNNMPTFDPTCRGTVLDITRLDLMGYDCEAPIPDDHPFTPLISVADRICTPFYAQAIQNDTLNSSRWINTLRSSKALPAVLQMGVRTGTAKGSTPLHAAAKLGNIEMMELLLGNGVDAFCQNAKGSTPLHNVVRGGSLEAVRMLLRDPRGDASAVVTDCHGCTPLMVAIERKRRDLVPLLFKGEEQLVRQVDGASVMHIAAHKHDLHTIRLLRQYIGSPLGQLTSRDETVLHWAVRGAAERAGGKRNEAKADDRLGRVLDELIAMEANIWQMNVDGNTVLHTAAEEGCEVAVLKVLQAAGAQWKDLLYTRKNQQDYTPLMSAAASNRTGVMELILSRKWASGSVRFFQSSDLQNALVVAAEKGHHEVLQRYGDQLQRDVYYNYDWAPALLNAAEKNLVAVVSYLMGKGVWPNHRLDPNAIAEEDAAENVQRWGDATPLLVACSKAHHEIVALLLKQGSELLLLEELSEFFTQRMGDKGPTPLLAAITSLATEAASASDAMKTVDYLLEFARREGININLTNVGGLDPWCVVARNGAEINVTAPAGSVGGTHSGRKHRVEYGQDVGVTKILTRGRTRVQVESPVTGWIAVEPQQPCIVPFNTPLHVAIEKESVSVVEKLLRHYSKPTPDALVAALEQPDRRGFTPLLLAANVGLAGMVELLLKYGADASVMAADKESMLHLLADKPGSNPEVEAILNFYEDDGLARRLNGKSRTNRMISLAPHSSMGLYAESGEGRQGVNGHVMKYVDRLLEKTQPPALAPHAGKSALEIACSTGAVTVVGWILGQYQALMAYMSKEQVERVAKDKRRGFELALEKLPLNRGNKSQWYFLGSAVHRHGEGDPVTNWVAIVNLMLQYSVPIPRSISAGDATSLQNTPLTKLFDLIMKLAPEKFAPRDFESLEIKPVSPNVGVSTPCVEDTHKPSLGFPESPVLHRRRRDDAPGDADTAKLVIPLCQDWLPADAAALAPGERCLSVGSHEVLLTLSIALARGRQPQDARVNPILRTPGFAALSKKEKVPDSPPPSAAQTAPDNGTSGNLQRLRATLSFALPAKTVDVPATPESQAVTPTGRGGALPFDEVELLYAQANEDFENGNMAVRMELSTTQTGVHIQFVKTAPEHGDMKIRIRTDKPSVMKNGFLYFFDKPQAGADAIMHDTTCVLSGTAPSPFGFLLTSAVESFCVEKWAKGLSEDEAIECSTSLPECRNRWVPLTRKPPVDPGPTITNFIVPLEQLLANPLSCSQHDLFLNNLSRTQDRPDEFILFSPNVLDTSQFHRHPLSPCTSYVWGRIVMAYLRQLVSRGEQTPLKVFDVVGAELTASDETELCNWIRSTDGLLSNLQALRWTSHAFGEIHVTRDVDEVRPLASLCAGVSSSGTNFALDMKYITCTVEDSSRRCKYEPRRGTYMYQSYHQTRNAENVACAIDTLQRLVDQQDLLSFMNREMVRGGSQAPWTVERLRDLMTYPWLTIADVVEAADEDIQQLGCRKSASEVRRLAHEEAERLSIYPDLTEENYTEYFATDFPGRKDVLLKLMQSPNQHVIDAVNEALDYLTTNGRGVKIDLERFSTSNTPAQARFSMEHTKHLFEYVKRKKAAQSLKFPNLNFIHDGAEGGSLRAFIQSKLLRGLSCTSIDFGKDNKHIGEIFMTVATSFSALVSGAAVPADNHPSVVRARDTANGHSGGEKQHPATDDDVSLTMSRRVTPVPLPGDDALEIESDANKEKKEESVVSGVVTEKDDLSRTPLDLFFLEGVPFFVTDELQRYPLHYLIQLLHERKEAIMARHNTTDVDGVANKQTVLYQSTFRVVQHVISSLSSRDPCYFLEWGKLKCDDITPLRLAIHYQLDEIVELMIGLKRNRLAGLLKRHLYYEPERLELDHFVDLWGCSERDYEGLLPLHAAMILVGVCDYEEAVQEPDGLYDDVVLRRYTLPYQLQTTEDKPRDVLTNTCSPMNMTTMLAASQLGIAPFGEGMRRPSNLYRRPSDDADDVEDCVLFMHPASLTGVMAKVRLLRDRDRLVTYIDTVPETEAKLGLRAQRALIIARLLIACSFVPRSIKVAGNPPPRGSKQYVEVPEVEDLPEESVYKKKSRTIMLPLTDVWPRTGINSNVIPKEHISRLGLPSDDYTPKSNTLILALKFAPYLVSDLFGRWGDLLELCPKATLEPLLGKVHLQIRRRFTAVKHILNQRDGDLGIGTVQWNMEESGLNLAHWAAIRDQRRLLEKYVGSGGLMVTTTAIRRQTPLHLACYAGTADCLKVLLPHVTENGVGLNWVDAEGNTPLHVAVSLCHPVCSDALSDYGAKSHWRNNDGVDPHDASIAVLLHHRCQESAFRHSNLMRDWERDHQILQAQVQSFANDPSIQKKLAAEAYWSFFLSVCLYLVLISVMCVVVDERTSMFNPSRYYSTKGVENLMFYEPTNDTIPALNHVATVEEMYAWIRVQIFGTLFSATALEPNPLFGLLFLAGKVRMRQVRVVDGSCSRPDWVNRYWMLTGCYGAFSEGAMMIPTNLSTSTYLGTPWVQQKASVTFYGWKTAMDLFYPDSGFVVDFNPMDLRSSMDKLAQLEDIDWIDLQTRAVFLEMNMYNPNENRWVVSRILFEFSEHGGIKPSYRVMQTRLDSCIPGATSKNLQCSSSYEVMVFFLECGLLLSVVSLTYNELYDLYSAGKSANEMAKGEKQRKEREREEEAAEHYHHNRLKKKKGGMAKQRRTIKKKLHKAVRWFWRVVSTYLLSEWNIMDALSVAVFWMTFANRIELIMETMNIDPGVMIAGADPLQHREYYDLWRIASGLGAERELSSCVLFLFFLKLLKHLTLLPGIGPIVTAITSTIADFKVLVFFVVFLVFSSAMVLGWHCLMAPVSAAHKSLGDTATSFLQMVMGQWDYAEATKSSWFIAPAFFVATLLLVNLILMNIFIAVIAEIYDRNLATSQETWSWQVIDEYQYKLTGLQDPSGRGGNFLLLYLSRGCEFIQSRGRICGGKKRPDEGELNGHLDDDPFLPRVMRKEAASRYLRVKDKLHMKLTEVSDSVRAVSETVTTGSERIERLSEHLERLDVAVSSLQASFRDERPRHE